LDRGLGPMVHGLYLAAQRRAKRRCTRREVLRAGARNEFIGLSHEQSARKVGQNTCTPKASKTHLYVCCWRVSWPPRWAERPNHYEKWKTGWRFGQNNWSNLLSTAHATCWTAARVRGGAGQRCVLDRAEETRDAPVETPPHEFWNRPSILGGRQRRRGEWGTDVRAQRSNTRWRNALMTHKEMGGVTPLTVPQTARANKTCCTCTTPCPWYGGGRASPYGNSWTMH